MEIYRWPHPLPNVVETSCHNREQSYERLKGCEIKRGHTDLPLAV